MSARYYSGVIRGDAAWKALKRLAKGPAAASEVGAAVWPERTGRTSAVQGGGDYAAQMLLGRLRRRKLARVLPGDGSSVWAIETKGRELLARLEPMP